MLCLRACNARASARNVVACPFPHEDVIESPKITIFKLLPLVPLASTLCGADRLSSKYERLHCWGDARAGHPQESGLPQPLATYRYDRATPFGAWLAPSRRRPLRLPLAENAQHL